MVCLSPSVHRGLTQLVLAGDAKVFALVDESVGKGDGNESATAVNHYKKWCVARGDRIFRPLDPLITPLAVKKREVIRMAHFALFLVQQRGVAAAHYTNTSHIMSHIIKQLPILEV